MQKKKSRTKLPVVRYILECHFGNLARDDQPSEFLSDTQVAGLGMRLAPEDKRRVLLINNRVFSIQMLEYSEIEGILLKLKRLPIRHILINRQVFNRKIKITGGHVELSTSGGFMAGGYIPHVEVIEKEE